MIINQVPIELNFGEIGFNINFNIKGGNKVLNGEEWI
jgi:hypothetical protein